MLEIKIVILNFERMKIKEVFLTATHIGLKIVFSNFREIKKRTKILLLIL